MQSQSKKKKSPMNDDQIAEAARLFGLLSEPSRLTLLRELMNGPLPVGHLVQKTGMGQANASKHLALLLEAGFVSRQREGNFAIYRISDPRLKELCNLMCRRIADSASERARKLRMSAQ
jgi:DNA-binding transcriptional ArsR family regulator